MNLFNSTIKNNVKMVLQDKINLLATIVQRLDNAIQQIKRHTVYSVNKC